MYEVLTEFVQLVQVVFRSAQSKHFWRDYFALLHALRRVRCEEQRLHELKLSYRREVLGLEVVLALAKSDRIIFFTVVDSFSYNRVGSTPLVLELHRQVVDTLRNF